MFKKILSWIAFLFRPKPIADDERFDLYEPKQRLIYKYFNGDKIVSADPMILHRKMMAKAPDLYIDSKVATFPNKDSGKAQVALTKNIREIFGVKPLDEGGLTELETAELWKSFLIYCEWVKKNWNPPPTSPEGTSDPTGPSSGGSPPTLNTSASGSTASEPSSDKPIQLPSELVLPSESTQETNTLSQLATDQEKQP